MNVIDRKHYLKLLAQSKTPYRRRLLTNWACKKGIDAVSEIALNCLKGNIKLSKNKLYEKAPKRCISFQEMQFN